MQVLSLAGNRFIGKIPDISMLTELRVLDLRDAELVNLEPVTCLRQLRKLLVSFAAGRCLKGTLEPLAASFSERILYCSSTNAAEPTLERPALISETVGRRAADATEGSRAFWNIHARAIA